MQIFLRKLMSNETIINKYIHTNMINKVKIIAAILKKQTSFDKTSLLYEKELNSDVKPRINNKL